MDITCINLLGKLSIMQATKVRGMKKMRLKKTPQKTSEISEGLKDRSLCDLKVVLN